MEKRVLLAIFLSFLVLYVYQALVVKPQPKPGATSVGVSSPTQGRTARPTSNPASSPTAGPTPSPTPGPASIPTAPAAAALVGEPSEREVSIETQDVIAVFTNRGARLKSLRLKHYL